MVALLNVHILTPLEVIEQGAVVIDSGKILFCGLMQDADIPKDMDPLEGGEDSILRHRDGCCHKGSHCLGFHIEGPHLSPKRHGMANPDWFIPLTIDDLREYQSAAGGHIRMITFAPEGGGGQVGSRPRNSHI